MRSDQSPASYNADWHPSSACALRDDWIKVFERDEITESIRRIT